MSLIRRALTRVAPEQRIGEALDSQGTRPANIFRSEGTASISRNRPARSGLTPPQDSSTFGERRAIAALDSKGVDVILLLNRPTIEFGCAAFGRDCYLELMTWIEQNYEVTAAFGDGASGASEIGEKGLFIKAYRRRIADGRSR